MTRMVYEYNGFVLHRVVNEGMQLGSIDIILYCCFFLSYSFRFVVPLLFLVFFFP